MKATLVGAFLSIIGRIQGRYALSLVLGFLAANRWRHAVLHTVLCAFAFNLGIGTVIE